MSPPSYAMTPEELASLCTPPNILSLRCPASAPPPGQMPLNRNGYTLMPVLIGVVAGSGALVFFPLMIRLYTRIHLIKVFALEDALMILAIISLIGFDIGLLTAAPWALARHYWDTSIADLYIILHHQYPCQIMWTVHIWASKSAVVLQVKQLFNRNGVRHWGVYWGSWSILIFLLAYHIAVLFVAVFPCTPIRRVWDRRIPGTCINPATPGSVGAIGNLIIDIAMLALPIMGVWNLQMPRNKKIGVAAVFAVGGLACIASAMRIHYTMDPVLQKDYTIWVIQQAICALAEAAAVNMCFCFPVFPRFLKHLKNFCSPKNGTNSGAASDSYHLSEGSRRNCKTAGKAGYWDIDEGGQHTYKGESEERIIGLPGEP